MDWNCGGLNCLNSRTNTVQNHTNNTTIKAFAANVLKDNIGNKAAIAKLFIDKKIIYGLVLGNLLCINTI
jgi:hypothetical protein